MTEDQLIRRETGWSGRFRAMASPCEILIDSDDRALAAELLDGTAAEARRIETKFSRYRDDNIIARINNSRGRALEVDNETGHLLDFAQTLYELSDGLFDITSGVLREIWVFDGGDRLPGPDQIETILDRIGWHKVTWSAPNLRLPAGMQIDFGGIGKEYAVDRCCMRIRQHTDTPCLINFGGDLAVTGPRKNDSPWHVGIESVNLPDSGSEPVIALKHGALATSGDARRYLLKNGIRYSHILNPKTGRPVEQAPRAVTVAAPTCTQAGMLSTLAMLRGGDCEAFLDHEGVRYWCLR